jgi:hypothetical protein
VLFFSICKVSLIDDNEIEMMFGGAPPLKKVGSDETDPPKPTSSPAAGGGFSTNAYMLVYRRVDPVTNVFAVPSSEIPAAVREQIQQENEEFLKERAEYIKRRDAIHCNVWYASDPSAPEELKSFQVSSNKHETLEQLLVRTRGLSRANCRVPANVVPFYRLNVER